MPAPDRLAALEAAYLAARDARDRLDVARASGEPADASALEAEAGATEQALRERLAASDAGGLGADDEGNRPYPPGALDGEDARALASIRAGIETAFGADAELPVAPVVDAAVCDDDAAWDAAIEGGGTALRERLEGCYGLRADALEVDGGQLRRPQVLARLATDPDPDARRRLFLALSPLWRAVDGTPGRASPYRALIRESRARWTEGLSPIAANERALGLEAGAVERWATAILEAWRNAVAAPAARRGEPPIEPWDWWWRAGEADRALADVLPLDRVVDVNRRVHAAIGAKLGDLGIRFDTTPRPGRPALPVAFTTFGARPHRRADGSWDPGRPTVFANYVDGGLGDLNELVHETGHAIHIAAIRTRPAFADWPDADALTEALAELVTLDVGEPAWNARWIDGAPAIPAAIATRSRFAQVALDAAWALLEIRLHAGPERAASDVWTEITSETLGVAPHPEWSWWAMRGQLVQEPGYMSNYAVGAVLAADLRATIRAARGDWIDGDPGWYAWVSERVYRYGQERSAGDLLRDVLGRAPNEAALLADIARARSGPG